MKERYLMQAQSHASAPVQQPWCPRHSRSWTTQPLTQRPWRNSSRRRHPRPSRSGPAGGLTSRPPPNARPHSTGRSPGRSPAPAASC